MKTLLTTLTLLTLFIASPAWAATSSKFATVNGLVCDFCARALEKVFSKQGAIDNIDVNLNTKIITLNFKDGMTLDNDTITTLITDAGYNVVSISDTPVVNADEPIQKTGASHAE